MNYKIKIGILSLLIFIKVTLFWNIGYSTVVITSLIVLLCFSILFSVFRLVNLALDYPPYLQKAKEASPSNLEQRSQERLNNYSPMLRRKDLSNFFQVFFALPILINLLELLFLKSLSSGEEIMSNSILADITWIVIDMVTFSTTKFIRKVQLRLFQKAKKTA